MRVLIDGDIIKYRAGFAAERMEYLVVYEDAVYDEQGHVWCVSKKDADSVMHGMLDKGIKVLEIRREVRLEPVANALHNVRSMIDDATVSVGAEHADVTVFLSGKGNYREGIATIRPYKGNRDKKHTPTHGPAIISYIQKTWDSVMTVDEEADDAMGIVQCSLGHGDSVIVTIDKDLDMIPGLHYNPVKREKYFVTEDEADAIFWVQLLSGDSTDNIVGVPGIGPVKATAAYAEVLADLAEDDEYLGVFPENKAYEVARTLYVQGYGDDADDALLENGRLIWIRREEGQLWQPPTI